MNIFSSICFSVFILGLNHKISALKLFPQSNLNMIALFVLITSLGFLDWPWTFDVISDSTKFVNNKE